MDEQKTGLIEAPDGSLTCFWHGNDDFYRAYHDAEWGRPVADDRRLFEKICLEGFQSGLSWITILRKRENFRRAFSGFDIESVAAFGEADVERLVADPGIVRHRGKIVSAVNNARRTLDLIAEFGSLAAYFWRFEPAPSERPATVTYPHLKANPTSPTSECLSKDLRRRGFTSAGPTPTSAHRQGRGLVNAHMGGCSCRAAIEAGRAAFVRPA